MKHLIAQILVLGSLIGSAAANAASPPEQFSLNLEVSLRKLTPDPKHPGGVVSEDANGSGSLTAFFTLDKCELQNGIERCSDNFRKSLKIDGADSFFFVNVYNTANSDKHTIMLFVCAEAVKDPSECKKAVTSQIDFHGKIPPRVSIYDSGHPNYEPGNPATYQPVLTIGEEIK